MYWELTITPLEDGTPTDTDSAAGRFVLHRRHGGEGTRLDLRLEHGSHCVGWRLDGAELPERCWAVEKAPHPLRWLEDDGGAARRDSGVYHWEDESGGGRRIVLHGAAGSTEIRARRMPALPPRTMEAVTAFLDRHGLAAARIPELLEDGREARQRALTRLCGLGRELDGSAFDAALWRDALANASLAALHKHLEPYEQRLEARHPPTPVSKPEPLPDGDAADRAEMALRIARE